MAQEEGLQVSDRYTSMQEKQHTASQQHLPGSTTPNSVLLCMMENEIGLAHLGISPPTFFINIITSDGSYSPFVLVPMVSCVLPYT
jgi:hypothetical protein